MPVKSIGFPLVRLELLDVVAVLDGAQSSNVVGRDNVGVEARDKDPMIGDIAVRNVPRPEVIVDAKTEERRVGTVHATVDRLASVGRRGRGRPGGFDDSTHGRLDGRLEDFDDSSDEVGLPVTFVPRCCDVDVICAVRKGRKGEVSEVSRRGVDEGKEGYRWARAGAHRLVGWLEPFVSGVTCSLDAWVDPERWG